METKSSGIKKLSFAKGLLFFMLGLLALIGMSSIFSEWMPSQGTDNRIGVVEIIGLIQDSQSIIKQIKEFREDKRIRGIVLRIDSPGGAVGPSQEIYAEVLKTRNSSKTVYASMGTLAASGGYYIASAANRIFANPGTLTGSIGVIMVFPNIKGLMDKLGLQPEIIKAGKYKDIGSPVRNMTKKEKNLLQNVATDVHQQFIEAVAKGRNISIEEVSKVADGRILTGRQAHALRLVDQLGGLEVTIEQLAREVKITGAPQIIKEKRNIQFLDWLLQATINQTTIQKYLQSPVSPLQYTWLLGNL